MSGIDLVELLRKDVRNFNERHLSVMLNEAADEIESLRKQLAAFYRIQTQGMSASIDKGQNVARGQE